MFFHRLIPAFAGMTWVMGLQRSDGLELEG